MFFFYRNPLSPPPPPPPAYLILPPVYSGPNNIYTLCIKGLIHEGMIEKEAQPFSDSFFLFLEIKVRFRFLRLITYEAVKSQRAEKQKSMISGQFFSPNFETFGYSEIILVSV